MMKKMKEIMSEAHEAIDHGMKKIGYIANDAKSQLESENLSGATQSIVSKIITMVKNAIEHCTGQVQSILQPGIDGEMSKMTDDIKSKMSQVIDMKYCAQSNGKQLSGNSDSLVSCTIEPVKKIAEQFTKVVNLITSHVNDMVNSVISGIQKCTQSSKAGLMGIFSSDNGVLCILKIVQNFEFEKLKLAKLVIEQILQTLTEAATEAGKVPICSTKVLTGYSNQLTDIGLTTCISK